MQARGRSHKADTTTRAFLFADLRGFTELVERAGATEGRLLLSRYRAVVRTVVRRFGGAEIKTEGDSFYVTFTSASRALRAAIALQSALRDAVQGEPIAAGIGIHTGEALAYDSGFVGSAVNIAARACALAGPGEIVATGTVRELTRSVVAARWEALGERALKGVDEPVRLFRVDADPAQAAGSREARPDRAWPAAPRTGRALALTGLGGLVVTALVVVGWSTLRPPATPGTVGPTASLQSPRVSAPPTTPLEAHQEQLRSRLPPSLSGRCVPGPEAETPSTATITCALPGQTEPNSVRLLWSYDHPEAADERIRAEATRRDLPAGDCATLDSAIDEWRNGSVPVGWLACFLDSTNQAWIEWTYSSEGIEAVASARDRASRELFDWWRQTAPILVAR